MKYPGTTGSIQVSGPLSKILSNTDPELCEVKGKRLRLTFPLQWKTSRTIAPSGPIFGMKYPGTTGSIQVSGPLSKILSNTDPEPCEVKGKRLRLTFPLQWKTSRTIAP
ncbi:hypothetical protein CDAR_306221 [Caerostris darwini]|uniref:Uncharacterized protein n=1 Tax=Caerostris darwini TaxID=1538125 RepID=A0AAV4VCH6_9ARAC|nr:hypothetical protein CDAR_306221 [Caerostris darwini]